MWIDISQPLYDGMKVWPGDVDYKIVKTSEITKGESVNTAAVTISTHTGTHIDAPYHYDKDGEKIHEIDINKISGEAQVVSLIGVEIIERRDIAELLPLQASKILFKTTETFHDYHSFPSFSKEAIKLLGEEGVGMIGTDAPSVDPLTSKDLPAHMTCKEMDIYILEGLRLKVDNGRYELMALPLLLDKADGSPVRAVIRSLE